MKHRFGIELEITGITQGMAKNALKAVGMEVRCQDYNHTTRNYWKIVPDSSVHAGFEIVSPILHGDSGIEMAEIASGALEDAGACANSSCGFHVHIDAADIQLAHMKNIVRRYAKHEAEIDAFMPPSRRGNANTYCKSLNEIMGEAFEQASTISQLAHTQPSRYYKVNLQSYQRHGTVEFRQHSGTVNCVKICNWIRFLDEFITQCGHCQATENNADQTGKLTKTNERLVAMFEANGIASLDDICLQFGWLPHTGRSAIARLRRLGYQIYPEKINGCEGYRLAGQGTGNDGLWNGISRKVALFYHRRAAVLALAA